MRSQEHTSELQSPLIISYAVFCLKKEVPLLDEDHILGFDEIEVSKDDAKCKLAEKWLQKTAVGSELQVNENDTQIHICLLYTSLEEFLLFHD